MSGTVVVSQLGARMHYAVPRILHEAGRLERLHTDICATKGWPRGLQHLPQAMLPAPLRRLRGRVPYGIPSDRISSVAWIGLASVTAQMINTGRAAETRAALKAAARFSRAVVRNGFGAAEGFYGISGECLEQLQAARVQGLWTAVEQIIAPREIVDRLTEAEAMRHPDWGETFEPDPLAGAFAEREKAEWASADIVVCPSEFVRSGIAAVGGPVERCVIVPYGVDARFLLPPRGRHRTRPLRVLTVGAVGLRKGSPYVLEAAKRLRGAAEFRLVGPAALPPPITRMLSASLDMTGQIPRSEIARHYAWADVFLLPSVCEGSATAIYEALAAGLPVTPFHPVDSPAQYVPPCILEYLSVSTDKRSSRR
jgi:glycosyltransferase involved in cell wall biosynthesis